MKAPPAEVTGLHHQFHEQLTQWFSSQGKTLTQSNDAPAIVTIVNSSRIISDIQRDLEIFTG